MGRFVCLYNHGVSLQPEGIAIDCLLTWNADTPTLTDTQGLLLHARASLSTARSASSSAAMAEQRQQRQQ